MLSKTKVAVKDVKYISNANPFAPSANNPMIGARRTYTSGYNYPIPMMHYQMTPADFAQILVYSPWCASSAPGKYPVNLYSQTNIVISPLGRNLEETILRHCVAIPHSSRPNVDDPDMLCDRPRWEWDSEEECFLHPRSNMLANAFFNGVELLASPNLNKHGFIEYIHVASTLECLHPTKETTYPAFQRDKENSAALCYNPYTIRRTGEFDDGTVKFIAAEYNLSKTASSLFLAATKQLNYADSAHILNTNQMRLYKYCPFSAFVMNNILHNTLYCSPPSKFNDPFDSFMGWTFISNNTEHIQQALEITQIAIQIIQNKTDINQVTPAMVIPVQQLLNDKSFVSAIKETQSQKGISPEQTRVLLHALVCSMPNSEIAKAYCNNTALFAKWFCQLLQKCIAINVSDESIAMSAAEIARLFDPECDVDNIGAISVLAKQLDVSLEQI